MSFSHIFEYIPQRPPFVMVDCIVKIDEENTSTSLEIKENNIFVEEGKLFEAGIIENIAQTIAAGSGYRAKQSGGKPKVGVIGSIRKLQIHERPIQGETITTKVELISEFGKALVVKGTVTCGQKNIADCQMNVFIIDKTNSLIE